MKIVEVINLPWWNASAEYCISLSKTLSNRGHGIIVICEKDTPAHKKAIETGLEIDTLLTFKQRHILKDLLNIRKAFRGRYRDVQIVNVHTANAQSLFVIARLLFRLDFKLIKTRIDARKIKPHLLNRLSYRALEGVIVTNKKELEDIKSFAGISLNRIKVIHGSVDAEYFRPVEQKGIKRQKFNIPVTSLVVGNIARRSPIKGHDVFFKSAHLINTEIKNVFFVVAGVDDTISIDKLKNMAESAGVLDKTLFLGFVKDINELLECLDIGVVSSLGSENHSRITLEYMACGVPVVGSDVGAVGELIENGKTGFVVKPFDFVGLAEAVIRLLKKKEMHELFSYNARNMIEERYSSKTFAEKTEQFYAEVLSWKT